MAKKIENYDVIIIGGGASGLTAGIYSGRARLKTLIIEQSLVGGLITSTDEIENYPGFVETIKGLELMNLFEAQAKKFGVKFKLTDVKAVHLDNNIKIVETFRTDFHCKVVIIATGGKPRITGATGEDKYLFDKGISFCATCDAAANTDKTVMVIGSGDTAIEEGIFLTKFAKKVIVSIVHEEGKMDCNEIAKMQALANPKMEFLWNTMVDSFEGGERLERVVLKNLKDNNKTKVTVDSCFLFIGYIPNTTLFKDTLTMSSNGYLITDEEMKTNLPGIFAVGDVRDKLLKQVSTAVGDGAIAGYGAERYIAEEEIFENQVLNEGKETLVYFYNASDKESLKMISIVNDFAERNENKVSVVKIDIYKSDGIPKRLKINTFPITVFLKDKKIVKSKVGILSFSDLEELIS